MGLKAPGWSRRAAFEPHKDAERQVLSSSPPYRRGHWAPRSEATCPGSEGKWEGWDWSPKREGRVAPLLAVDLGFQGGFEWDHEVSGWPRSLGLGLAQERALSPHKCETFLPPPSPKRWAGPPPSPRTRWVTATHPARSSHWNSVPFGDGEDAFLR